MEKNNEVKRTQGEWFKEVYKSEGEIHIFSSIDPIVAICSLYCDPLNSETYANAEFICKAVNEHDSLIEEKEYALSEGKRLSDVATHWKNEYDKLKTDNEVLLNALKVIKTTLKGMIAGRPHSYDDAAKEGVERIDNLIKQCESK